MDDKTTKPTIIIDTREKVPFDFMNLPSMRGTLKTGDYSLLGYADRVAIERKSLADFIGSISHDRKRFERELERFQDFDAAYILIEADLKDLWMGRYKSQMHPNSVIGTLASFEAKYNVQIIFASDHCCASIYAERLLMKWHKYNALEKELAIA